MGEITHPFFYNSFYDISFNYSIIMKKVMKMDFNLMLEYVKEKLIEGNAIRPNNQFHQFRNRFEHSKRVYKWVKILSCDFDDIDLDVALTAAIFHDVGYSVSKDDHAKYSADIYKEYASTMPFSEEFNNKVVEIILNHSDKSLLKTKDNHEFILVLEADLLDEEGSLGIVWDLLAEGRKGAMDYSDAIDELYKHSTHILNQDYMVTPMAIKIWNQKKMLVEHFIEQLKFDLFIED